MKKYLTPAGLVAAVALVAFGLYTSSASADSQSNHLKASLTGYQEVPSVSSTGTGSLDLRIDDNMQTIDYVLTYENLEGTTTAAAHIHLGQPGANGGVSVFLCGGGGRPACTPTFGEFSGTITPTDIIGPVAQGISPGEFAELVQALRSRVTYANVHTNRNPGGEIRGLIQ